MDDGMESEVKPIPGVCLGGGAVHHEHIAASTSLYKPLQRRCVYLSTDDHRLTFSGPFTGPEANYVVVVAGSRVDQSLVSTQLDVPLQNFFPNCLCSSHCHANFSCAENFPLHGCEFGAISES